MEIDVIKMLLNLYQTPASSLSESFAAAAAAAHGLIFSIF
jgi:hypothetical protein